MTRGYYIKNKKKSHCLFTDILRDYSFWSQLVYIIIISIVSIIYCTGFCLNILCLEE